MCPGEYFNIICCFFYCPSDLNGWYFSFQPSPLLKSFSILKEYSAKKYGRRREFVDAETRARLWLSIEEDDLPDNSNSNSDSSDGEQNSESSSEE